MNISNYNGNYWLRIGNRYLGYCPNGIADNPGVDTVTCGPFVYQSTAEPTIGFTYCFCIAIIFVAMLKLFV